MRTALALLAVCLLANSVDAGLIIDFEEAGGNVTATLSGSLTIGGSRNGRGQLDAEDIAPGFGVIDFGGGTGLRVDVYNSAVSGPAFGSGGNRNASAHTGDFFGLDASSGILRLPTGYVSGDALNATITFDHATFSSLGLKSGTSFKYTITTGTAVDTAIIQIGPQAVPEPSTLTMAMLGVVAVGGVVARRRGERARGIASV